MQLPVWLFWILGVLLITWFIAGDDPLLGDREREGFYLLKKLRRIVVQGQTYLWKFTPGYVVAQDPANPWQCHDHFTAYLLEAKNSPLHISFLTWEDAIVGGPLRTGLPLDLDKMSSESWRTNFHTLKYAAWIIQMALEADWKPEQSRSPFVMGSQHFYPRTHQLKNG